MVSKSLKLLFILTVFQFFVGCASDNSKTETPEGAFKFAKEFEDADRYEIAIQKYADVKNKFPYSSYAVLAELAIADVQYKRESYAESQIAYQNFRELHPKHVKIDFVLYRIGMSYFLQLPDTIDRDLSLAQDAIYSFNEVIKTYPNSEHLKDAREYREKAYVMLVEKELYVADFYFKQKKYDSALTRYETAYRKYPGFGYDPKSLLGASRAAEKLSDTKKQKQYSSLLISKFGNSDEAKTAKSEGL
ncbi:MAG: outer membrane protein assembly factor BamD [Bdellovibrio sp.]|nr:outer membrane protein assembly factor BamD [Bdellovibrio sp.]